MASHFQKLRILDGLRGVLGNTPRDHSAAGSVANISSNNQILSKNFKQIKPPNLFGASQVKVFHQAGNSQVFYVDQNAPEQPSQQYQPEGKE